MELNRKILIALFLFGMFSSVSIAFGETSQDGQKGFGIGKSLTLFLFDSNLNLDSDKTETHSLDLIEFQSDNIRTTLGPNGGVQDAFNPRPSALRETGDNTGIFYTVIEIPRTINGKTIDFGEKIEFEYTQRGIGAKLVVKPGTFSPDMQQSQQTMSVSTDKPSYNFGEFLTINGQGAESYSISIIILSPAGEEITELSTFKTSAGEFSTLWIIPNGLEHGTYTITASDASQEAQTTITIGTLNSPQTFEPPKSKTNIPGWVKNNAKWWSEGNIADEDFTSGIQFMIKENIINIPNLPEQASGVAEGVPDWVKNNAGWWADGLISDDDFVTGMKYLVEQGIIQV